jgi:septal ring-binding cell division protein DamX
LRVSDEALARWLNDRRAVLLARGETDVPSTLATAYDDAIGRSWEASLFDLAAAAPIDVPQRMPTPATPVVDMDTLRTMQGDAPAWIAEGDAAPNAHLAADDDVPTQLPTVMLAPNCSDAPFAPSSAAGSFTLQVAAYRDVSAAQALVDELRKRCLPAYYARGVVNDVEWHRVRLGQYASIVEAREHAVAMASSFPEPLAVMRVEP